MNQNLPLFQFDKGSYPQGHQNFNNNLIEQYKLACTASDNVSSRRETANRYLITLNTGITALYGFQATGTPNLHLLIPLTIAGLIAAIISLIIVKSHGDLNRVKFQIIQEIEEHLPARIYEQEWEKLKEPKFPQKYVELTILERVIYGMFATIHIIATPIIIFL